MESLEDFFAAVLGDSHAVVADVAGAQTIAGVGQAADLDAARPGRVEVVQRVADQVGEDLFDGGGVAA